MGSIAGVFDDEVDDAEVDAAQGTPPLEFAGKWETWDAHFIRDRQVGYRHIVAQEVGKSASGEVNFLLDDQLVVRREESTLIQRISQSSVETTDGQLIGFETELHFGPDVTRIVGKMEKEALLVETVRGSERSTTEIPWRTNYRGLIAVEQSLRRKKMKAGESRVLEMLLPVQHQIATVRLHCSGNASVPLIDGEYQTLLEIDSYIAVGNGTTHSVIWVDDSGKVRRTYSPQNHLLSYRTTKELATKAAADQGADPTIAAIDVVGELKRPADLKQVAFRISPSAGVTKAGGRIQIDPAPGQFVRAIPDGSYQVLVSRDAGPTSGDFIASDLGVVDGDREPNAVIDFRLPIVRKIADAVVSGRADLSDREVALELTSTVGAMIAKRNVSKGFSKASDVAVNSIGDSTERAVLLAALLRARKIPSRLAFGFVYAGGEQPRMVYHMWTLAHVDDQWLSLDAGSGGVAAPDRLTLGTTSLIGGHEYDAIAPILAALGRINIEIKGSRY